MSGETFSAPTIEHLAALLPSYEFEAFIAQGGMGAVYQARQRSLDRAVAIKILPREFGEDAEFRASFETEAKAMAKLNHPNLIGVYDFGDVDGMPYIVMEFVNGKSLFHSAYQLAVDPEQAVTIVKGICDGLAHAHENGIIHRDIKPANILLTPRAEPKIGDFGLARPAGDDSGGLVMGTPGYTAPEVLSQPEQADRRSDLFALGVVLYELLTGRCPPYDAQPPPPSTISRCDVSLDRICEKATHPIAALRYQSAGEMSSALDAWLHRARRGGHEAPPHPMPHAVPHRHPAGAHGHAPVRGKSRAGTAGLAWVAVLLIAALAGWKLLGGKSQSPEMVPVPTASGDPISSTARDPHPPPSVPALPGPAETPETTPDPDVVPEPAMARTDSEGPRPDDRSVGPNSGNPLADPAAAEAGGPTGAPPSEVADLDVKARELLKSLVTETNKEFLNNSKSLAWGLDAWLRNLPKSEQAAWSPSVAALKAMVIDNRVPISLEQSNLALSEKMSALCQQCADKQKSLDENYRAKAERIRASYLTRMKDLSEKLKSGGDANGSAHANSRAATAADLSPWLEAMGVPSYESGPVGEFAAGGGIVGHWRSVSYGARAVWFMKDGTCRSPDGKGTWEPDGSGYKVEWSGGQWTDQLTIERDGRRLSGINQRGDKVRLVREDSVPLGVTQEGAEEIAGWWKWLGMNDNIVEIRRDGTAYSYSSQASAKWEAKGGKGSRVFSITWLDGKYQGYVNEVMVSGDGRRLSSAGAGNIHAERGADLPR